MGAMASLLMRARGDKARRATGPGAKGQPAETGGRLGLGLGLGEGCATGDGGGAAGGWVGDEPPHEQRRTTIAALRSAALVTGDMADLRRVVVSTEVAAPAPERRACR